MNGFHDFDDFRVSAWVDGVTMRFAAAQEIVKKAVVKTVMPAVVAAAVVAASVLSVPSTVAAAPMLSPAASIASSGVHLDAELDLMAVKFDQELEDIWQVTSASVDSDLLALARSAFAASDARKNQSPSLIAEAFFANNF